MQVARKGGSAAAGLSAFQLCFAIELARAENIEFSLMSGDSRDCMQTLDRQFERNVSECPSSSRGDVNGSGNHKCEWEVRSVGTRSHVDATKQSKQKRCHHHPHSASDSLLQCVHVAVPLAGGRNGNASLLSMDEQVPRPHRTPLVLSDVVPRAAAAADRAGPGGHLPGTAQAAAARAKGRNCFVCEGRHRVAVFPVVSPNQLLACALPRH